MQEEKRLQHGVLAKGFSGNPSSPSIPSFDLGSDAFQLSYSTFTNMTLPCFTCHFHLLSPTIVLTMIWRSEYRDSLFQTCMQIIPSAHVSYAWFLLWGLPHRFLSVGISDWYFIRLRNCLVSLTIYHLDVAFCPFNDNIVVFCIANKHWSFNKVICSCGSCLFINPSGFGMALPYVNIGILIIILCKALYLVVFFMAIETRLFN